MALSEHTKQQIGREDLPLREDLSEALGVRTSVIEKAEISKAEEELLQTNALTVEDNDPFFTMYEITQRNALIKPTYDPWRLAMLTHANNTLLQCVTAVEVNVDGTGYVIEPKEPQDPEATVQGEIDSEQSALPEEEKENPFEKADAVADIKPKAKKEPKEFKAPPTTPEEVVAQAEEKHMADEEDRLAEEDKKERVQAIKDEEDEQRKGIEEFFEEPWPGMSFTTLRRKMRRDVETVGNAYMEVIRNVKGDIVFLNYLDAKLVRMVRLGRPVQVEQEVTRFGKTSTVNTLKRERRFAMLIGGTTTVSNVTRVMYFKEFNGSRDLNKWTGLWEGGVDDAPRELNGSPDDSAVPTDEQVQPVSVPGVTGATNPTMVDVQAGPVEETDKATEIIHFTALPDVSTLYGVPRWINQIPSVLGSRKAEELNLEFFNSGGLPPAMILIQGGTLSEQSRKALTGYMAGEAKHKQRGIIAEIFSTSGDLTSAGNVKVSVERFGAERQADAMFMKYDEACGKHVRMAWRLPPLFIGDSNEHNFATAQASYMVAEAQVFDPERKEFDEIVNTHIMKELAPEWVYRSKPLSINDVEQQIEALKEAKDVVDVDCWVGQVNEVAHLELECADDDPESPDLQLEVAQRVGLLEGMPGAVQNGEEGAQPFKPVPVVGGEFGKIAKISDDVLEDLAKDWKAWLIGETEFSDASVDAMRLMIDALSPSVRKMFNSYVATMTLNSDPQDAEGVADLLDHASKELAEKLCAPGSKGKKKRHLR